MGVGWTADPVLKASLSSLYMGVYVSKSIMVYVEKKHTSIVLYLSKSLVSPQWLGFEFLAMYVLWSLAVLHGFSHHIT